MTRRHVGLRLFVLAAMTLSFGESVWASTCASMQMTVVAEAAGAPGGMPDMPAMPGMPGMPGDGDQQGSEDDPWCPLGPAAVAQGCTTAVPLPASSVQALTALAEREGRLAGADTPSDLLYSTTLFHPPRG